MPSALTLQYLRALADLPHDRPAALAALETCFRNGATPGSLDGMMPGRVLTTTVGYGLDPIMVGLARAWMPWKGKTFDPEAKEGRNAFSTSFRVVQRTLWPGYDLDWPLGDRRYATFPFTTWDGPSVSTPGGADVLKIDYEHPQSPWMVRDILDELVRIDDELFLGQALLRFRGRIHRVAWFELRR